MPKRKTDAEFKQQIKNLVDNEYIFLDKYINSSTKIRVKHNTCGHVYKVKPIAFLRGNRCPNCFGTHLLTNNEFKKKIYDDVGTKYTFLDKYINNHSKIRVRHNKCGHIYKVSPHRFFAGNRCPKCYGNSLISNEDFLKRVYNSVGNEYSFLDKYKKNDTKIRVRHNKCGYIYKVSPHMFFRGNRCPKCYGTPLMTNNEFIKRVNHQTNGEYTFLDEYVNTSTKIRVRHNKCGYVYKISPNSFFGGRRCPKCSKAIATQKMSMTNKDFSKRVYNSVGNEYSFLDKYINNHTKIWVRHNKCGYVYKVAPSGFLRGNRCPKCYGNLLITNKEFQKRVYNLCGSEYTFLEKYQNMDTKIKVRHNKCGYIYKVAPDNFLLGNKCPKCSIDNMSTRLSMTNKEFQKRVYNLCGSEYTFLEKYQNMNTKIKVRHNKCGYIYKVKPHEFLKGRQCPKCSAKETISQGEKAVKKWLDKHNYSYKYGYIMKGLIDKEHLHLDFYLQDNYVAIEYDGQQHFKPIKYWHGKEGLKIQQMHDEMKNEYCKKHNIKLIRIKYNQDVDDVLIKQLGNK